VKPPEQSSTGRHFDTAVQAEADQGYGPGDQPGDDGNKTFGAVVSDGEVFDPLALANKVLAIRCSSGCHVSIIRVAHQSRIPSSAQPVGTAFTF
jgi:hypothetical protein